MHNYIFDSCIGVKLTYYKLLKFKLYNFISSDIHMHKYNHNYNQDMNLYHNTRQSDYIQMQIIADNMWVFGAQGKSPNIHKVLSENDIVTNVTACHNRENKLKRLCFKFPQSKFSRSPKSHAACETYHSKGMSHHWKEIQIISIALCWEKMLVHLRDFMFRRSLLWLHVVQNCAFLTICFIQI